MINWAALGGLSATILTIVVSVIVAYYTMEQRLSLRIALLSEKMTQEINEVSLQISRILEGDIRELRTRLAKVESGQDEWTRALRQRTHDLADEQQKILLRIDRLERPRGE